MLFLIEIPGLRFDDFYCRLLTGALLLLISMSWRSDNFDFDIDCPRSKVDYSLSYALFSRLFLSYSRIVSSMELIEAREYERESGVLSLLFLSRWS